MAARHRAPKSHRVRNTIVSVVVVALVVVVAFVAYEAIGVKRGLQTSSILEPTPGATTRATPRKDTNLLIMGLDSRVDVNGNPLPADIYEALHAGDQSDGGLNTNVLMLLHIPASGKAVEISIPRDDQAALVGCPDGECEGKIKQAYGLAVDQEQRRISGDTSLSAAEKYKQARDAGRKAEIATVEQFLGVTIDHFVEVTMVAFYQLAQVVQPITVCVLQDTQDSYSGANFVKGEQQIDASQALSFVRQRRDNKHPELNFTDLDRSRRQQAFIVSVASQLKQAGTLANPVKLNSILDVVKQNTVVDSGLDLLSFIGQAADLAGGNVTYYTLPVKAFGTNSRGEDVNLVDLDQIRATVKTLLAGGTPGAAPSPTTVGTPSGTSTTKTSKPSSSSSSARPTSAAPGSTPVPAASNPAPTDLSELGGGGIPCVK